MTHWKWQSRRRCSLAELVTTAGLGGRWPAITSVSADGKEPVAAAGRTGAVGQLLPFALAGEISREQPFALARRSSGAVNVRRRHQNGDAVERRASSAIRCVPRAGFTSARNRREIPTNPSGSAKW